MKILLQAFKPYKKYKENISEKIVRRIKNRKNLYKKVFEVKFNRKQFIDQIKKVKPNIIISLGQHPGSKKIRIERRACNLKRNNKEEKLKVILKGKPKYLYTNLKLKKDKNSRISYDAGDYVCNFSMYVILDYIKDKDIKFGFIHIPKDYNLNKAVKFIESKIKSF